MEKKKSFLQSEGVQALLCSLLCIVIGVLIGYVVLLLINPAGATDAILAILKNWANSTRATLRLKNLGSTLVNTAPLLLCSLSVLFAYKVGLFNIGASGQYTAGIIVSLYGALALHLHWTVCVVLAIIAGAIVGAISGALKAFQNVSEVISGIMLNWILLYTANMVLSNVKQASDIYTLKLEQSAPQAILPQMGLNTFFNNHQYVGIAIPIALIAAVVIWVVLEKTKLGYELKATGLNKNGAKYAGMKENRNIILTLAISGGLAGLAAACLYLTGIAQWSVASASVPGMGFNGIAAAFLGGLSPIGSILSSYFIQHITIGGSFVDLSVYPSQVADLISSIIIYLCGFVAFFKLMLNQVLTKKSTKGGKE
ncbi:MAG: ABC transporter permease [Bacillota bacterium]|nr:ABC transporter permease [Bacillota bacterium]